MEIRKLKPGDENILSNFFEEISKQKEVTKFFHPHSFSKKYANELVRKINKIKDKYYIAINNSKVVGYAMLRGLDEGYGIPSFGICVHPDSQGKGIGKELTSYCIREAINMHAPKIMLKVYKVNNRAIELYKSIGFNFEEETEDNKQFIGLLSLNQYE